MAVQIGADIKLSEGELLSPLVGLSVEEMMTEELERVCAQLEAMTEDNHQLRSENIQLRKNLFMMQVKLTKAYETIAQLNQQVAPSKAPVIDLTPLHTPEARELVARLQEGGLLDENVQPMANLSGAQKGLLANYMAGKLGIADLWQYFANLWHLSAGALRSAYNRSLDQKNTSEFLEKLKNITR